MRAGLADRVSDFASRHFAVVLSGIVALTVMMAVLGRAGHDFSNDEPFTALMLQKSAAEFRGVFADDNIPLWYALLRPWRAIFGESEWGLRSLAAILYAIALVVTALIGRRIAGPASGLLAAWLLATSARIGLRFAATARPYALLCLLAALATAGHLAAAADAGGRRRRDWIMLAGLVAVHLAGLFTQPLYAFFAAACALGSLVQLPNRRGVVFAAAPCAAVLIYLALWWPVLSATFLLPTTSWMTTPDGTDLMAGYLAIWGWRNGWVLAGVLLALVLVRRGGLREVSTPAWRFCVALCVLVVGGAFAASFAKPVFSAASTPIVILPSLAIAVAAALVRLGSPALTLVVSLLLFTSAAAYAVDGLRLPDPTPTSSSVAAVAREARCGDRIVAAGVSFAPVTWYARAASLPSCLSIDAFPAEMRGHPGWFDTGSTTSRRAELLAEAREIASRLGSDNRVWVFAADRGAGAEATQLLDDLPELKLEQRLPLPGTYFDHVRVYRAARAGGPR